MENLLALVLLNFIEYFYGIQCVFLTAKFAEQLPVRPRLWTTTSEQVFKLKQRKFMV